MAWKEKISDFLAKKYLGEIARELFTSLKKRPPIERKALSSHQIPYRIYLLYQPRDIHTFPARARSLIEKSFIQNTFTSDQRQRDKSKAQKKDTESISSEEIARTTMRVAAVDASEHLPVLDNLLFRDGLDEKAYAWHIMKQLVGGLTEVSENIHEQIDTESLMKGKIVFWEKDFLNMNHRHPDLFRLFQLSNTVHVDREQIAREFGCSKVFIGRFPPFAFFIALAYPESAGVLISFMDN